MDGRSEHNLSPILQESMIQQLIERYKRIRTERFLAQTYQYSYAFLGMGQHSLTNLYPVLHYLGVPLKYICVTSERKAQLIERKFPHVKATTSLDMILNDDEVKGVFVSASPSAHFSLASQILKSNKSLFIEKPPCQSLQELDALIDKQRLYGSPIAMVGLQKRYAPAVQILQKHLRLLPIFLANQKSSPVSKSPLHPTSLCSVIPTSSALLNSPPPTPGQPPKNPSRSAHQRASTASLRWSS